MLTLRGVSVWIKSGDEELPMYQEEVDSLDSASAYIASHAGKVRLDSYSHYLMHFLHCDSWTWGSWYGECSSAIQHLGP